MVRGNQAECGGAMVGKMANVLWLEGFFVEKMRTWELELECARMDGQGKKKAWVTRRNPCPFIKAVETERLPTCPIKSLIPQVPRLMARLDYLYPY